MQVKTTYREIIKIATPVIFGSMANTILNITDTAFLGRVGETELGASAVGGVLYFVFAMIGLSIGIGTQILIARRSGEKNDDAIGSIFDHSLIVLLALSVILFAILEWLVPLMLPLILNSQELIDKTSEFLHYRSYGIFFIMLATVFRSFYVGIAKPKIFGLYSFIMAAINMVLGYALIFGKLGFSEMGITGAGIASSASELIALIFLFIYTMMRQGIKRYRLFRFTGIRPDMFIKILNLSTPLVVQNLLSMGSWFIFFVFIEKIGKHELAISNIVRAAYMISMTPIWGFSVAANSMISNIIGQGKQNEVFELLNKIIRLTIMVALVMIIINLVIPVQLLSIFTSDEKLIQDSLGCLRIVDLAMIFFATAIVCISAVSGTGATKMALIIEIAAIFLYMLYNYLVTFTFKASVEVVWFSEVIYWVFTGVASWMYIRSMHWVKIKI
jgi:putative MATE family efflux protein